MCIVIKRFLSIIFKIINTAFLLCGIAIVVVGICLLATGSNNLTISTINKYSNKHITTFPMLFPTVVLIVFIVVGATILGISFLGCYGFKRQSMIYLISYAACLVMVIVALVIVCILLSVFKKELFDNLSKSFIAYQTRPKDAKFWVELQAGAKCCGLDGPADWTDGIPESCCGDEKSKDSKEATECRSKSPSKPYLYEKGCVVSVYDTINTYWNITLSTSVILMAISLLALIVAFIIICDDMSPGAGSSKRN